MKPVLAFSRDHQRWVVIPSYSLVGVFLKSLHLLAAAWVLVVAYLWVAIEPGHRIGDNLFLHAVLPAGAIEAFGLAFDRWLQSQGITIPAFANEWGHAVSWSALPVAFLIGGVFLVTA